MGQGTRRHTRIPQHVRAQSLGGAVLRTGHGLRAQHHRLLEAAMTRLAASVVLIDDQGRILLVHEDYGKRRWGLPGGRHEPGESIEETAIREAKEETNLDVELGELIGEYMIVSASGQELLDVSVFIATIVGGELAPNAGEIAEVGWFDPN